MDYLTRMLNCVLCESLTSGFANYSANKVTITQKYHQPVLKNLKVPFHCVLKHFKWSKPKYNQDKLCKDSQGLQSYMQKMRRNC